MKLDAYANCFPNQQHPQRPKRIHQVRFTTNSKPCTRHDWNGHENQTVLKLESFSWHVSQQWKDILDSWSCNHNTFYYTTKRHMLLVLLKHWIFIFEYRLFYNTYFGFFKILFSDTSCMNNLHKREFGIWNSGKTLLSHSCFAWNQESGINIANLIIRQNTESGIRN